MKRIICLNQIAYAKTVNICFAVVVPVLQNLGGDISRSPTPREEKSEVFFVGCKSQVNHHWMSVLTFLVEDYILWFEVSVDDGAGFEVC